MVNGLRKEVNMYRSMAFNAQYCIDVLFYNVIALRGIFFSVESEVWFFGQFLVVGNIKGGDGAVAAFLNHFVHLLSGGKYLNFDVFNFRRL